MRISAAVDTEHKAWVGATAFTILLLVTACSSGVPKDHRGLRPAPAITLGTTICGTFRNPAFAGKGFTARSMISSLVSEANSLQGAELYSHDLARLHDSDPTVERDIRTLVKAMTAAESGVNHSHPENLAHPEDLETTEVAVAADQLDAHCNLASPTTVGGS